MIYNEGNEVAVMELKELKKQLKEIALLEEEYTIEITNCWLTIKQKKLSIIKKNLV